MRDGLGRVTAAPVRARWPAPRAACAAMDGIAIKAGPESPAAAAGVRQLAAVSAPSSLAASLAEEGGLTLVGFLRGTTMNVYAGAQRVSV